MPVKVSLLLFLLVFLGNFFAVQSVQADKPKPKLLDGDLLEDGQPPSLPQPPPPTPQAEQTVSLLKEFTVSLPVTPSTGLVWRVGSYNRQFLQLLRHRYQRPTLRQASAAGQQHFDFLPLKSGRTTIVFVAQAPLVKTVAQERRQVIIIR